MGIEMKYFILKPKSKSVDDKYAQASRHAMKAYSNFIYAQDPALAKELYDWQKKEQCIEDAMMIANQTLDSDTKSNGVLE